MDPRDVLTRPADLPDVVVRYDGHGDALVDVYLPPRASLADPSPAPLVVMIHGGFWRAAYDRVHARPLAQALARDGFVVALPEYRRTGGAGPLAGGWPTTADDVDAAMAALPGLLDGLGIAVTTTTVTGHSAGGHLALWLANQPHRIDRVVALAPVGDLRAAAAQHLGDDATQLLLGGDPADVPLRYDAADPVTRFAVRPGCEIRIVHGRDDDIVPLSNSRGLVAAHRFVQLHELPGVEHYALIDPLSEAWPVVRAVLAGEPAPDSGAPRGG